MILSPFLRLAFCFAGSLLVSIASAQQTQYSHGDPSALEQQMLEYVNRARMNPTQEGVILDTVNTWYSNDARARKPSFFTNLRAEFASYPAVAPLAFNPKLIQAARAHAWDMISRNFFSHVNPDGQDPTARAAALGYDVGVGENIDGGGASTEDEVLESHFGFMVDFDNIDLANPLGHRKNILDSSYSEIGVGIMGARYGGKITQDFGGPARSYILGVAYSDANSSGSYDAGEGLAGITVKPDIGNWFAVTSTSGGFAIPIDPVQTVTDTVNVPFPVQGNSWAAVLPYDTAYRQQQLAAAPNITVNLTWSGGALSAPKTTSVTIKKPVLRNYKITGTDGWYYTMSMVTTQNVKADFTPNAASITPPKPSAPLRDFNGDGKGDLLFQNSYGQIVAWYMNSAGTATGSAWITSANLGDWKLKATADLNGDGNADLVFQNSYGQIVVWYTNGKGTVTSSAWITSANLGDWKVAGIADLNGDGNADIVLQNTYGQLVVWYMNGKGSISSSAWLSSAGLGDWKLAAIVDVDGDGNADLLFQNSYGQIVVWYLNGQASVTGTAWITSANLGDWKLVSTADLNGDGYADLVLQNSYGQVVVWYRNGRGLTTGSAWISSGNLSDWRLH